MLSMTFLPALEWNKPTKIMCFAFTPLPLKSSLCHIIVIFNIFLHIYYNEINLIIGIAYRCVYRSTDKKNVDAKRVIGSHKSKKGRQCNGQTKKDKLINSGLQKNYTEN